MRQCANVAYALNSFSIDSLKGHEIRGQFSGFLDGLYGSHIPSISFGLESLIDSARYDITFSVVN